jgi:hypothetical protein
MFTVLSSDMRYILKYEKATFFALENSKTMKK